MQRVESLVVGAGISGLAFAHSLGPDADVLVLEAADEVGGWLRTRAVEEAPGARFEVGAEALQTQPPGVSELCASIDLPITQAPSASSQRYLVHRGKLVAIPHSPLGLLSSGLLSATGKLRALSERARRHGTELEGSVADFVRARFGREVLESFVDAFVSGVHAGDPEKLSLRATFPALAKMVEEHGSVMAAMMQRKGEHASLFKPSGGMQRLPEALARRLGARLRLCTPVLSLRRESDGFTAVIASGEVRARRLAVATEGKRAAQLLGPIAPVAARELGGMIGESLVCVLHGWERDKVEHPLDGFGFLAASREGLFTLGTLFSSTIAPDCAPPGQVVLRTLMGGARRPELVDASDADLIARAMSENSKLLGLRAAPLWTRVLRYRGAIPRYDLDHPRRLAAIEADVASVPALSLLGNSLRGIGVSTLVPRAAELAVLRA